MLLSGPARKSMMKKKATPPITRKNDLLDLKLVGDYRLVGKFVKETQDSVHLYIKVHKEHILGIHNYETKETVYPLQEDKEEE